MTNTTKSKEYNYLKKEFANLENFEQYFPEEMPEELDLKELEVKALDAYTPPRGFDENESSSYSYEITHSGSY